MADMADMANMANKFKMVLRRLLVLTIYVGANYGDRIPSILVNTPGTPAASE